MDPIETGGGIPIDVCGLDPDSPVSPGEPNRAVVGSNRSRRVHDVIGPKKFVQVADEIKKFEYHLTLRMPDNLFNFAPRNMDNPRTRA